MLFFTTYFLTEYVIQNCHVNLKNLDNWQIVSKRIYIYYSSMTFNISTLTPLLKLNGFIVDI